MIEPADYAPFSSHGEVYKHMAPKGIPFCLTTDDVPGAKSNPSIKKYLHPPDGDKMFPESWMSPNQLRVNRSLQTSRMLNPLDPQYKLASGNSVLPGGADRIPNRIADLMDTSDIPGAKAESHYSRPVRPTRLEAHADDVGCHPTRHTHVRTRVSIGQGLDLFDIDIGKKQYGFKRTIMSSPLEPQYPNEKVETYEETENMKVKKSVIQPRKCKKNVLDKVLDKIYWKSAHLPIICKEYDPLSGNTIGHQQFRECLEQCGVKLSDQEFDELLSHTDTEQKGLVNYKDFERAIRLNGLDKDVAKPLGIDLGVHASPSSFGQGLQVLVDSQYRGKHILQGADYLDQYYNPLTGERRQSSLLTLSKESHHDSFREKAAALLKQRQGINFSSFMPSQCRHIKFPPTLYSQMPSRKDSSASSIIPLEKNFPTTSEGKGGRPDAVQSSNLPQSQRDLCLQTLQNPSYQGVDSTASLPNKSVTSTLPVIKARFGEDRKIIKVKPHCPLRYTNVGLLIKPKESACKQEKSKRSKLQNFRQRLMSERRIAEIQSVQFL